MYSSCVCTKQSIGIVPFENLRRKDNISTSIDEKSLNIVTYDSDDGYTIDYRMDEIMQLEDIRQMKEDNTILRKNVKELQQQLQKAYKRIKELAKNEYESV